MVIPTELPPSLLTVVAAALESTSSGARSRTSPAGCPGGDSRGFTFARRTAL